MRVVAHAGGMGWDELLVFAAPIVVMVVLRITGRRRARAAEDPDQDGDARHRDGEETT